MATPVQSAKATTRGGEVVTATFGSSVTVGNVVVVFCSADANINGSAETVTDNKGNTYTRRASTYGDGSTLPTGAAIWTTVVTTGGTSFQVTLDTNAANNRTAVGIQEWAATDVKTADLIDVTGTGLDQATGISTPAVADLADCLAGAVIVGVCCIDNSSGVTGGAVISATSGWTLDADASYTSVGGVNWPIGVVYRTATTAGQYDPSFDISAGGAWWATAGVSMKPFGTSFVPRRMMLGVG
jgi:hypothetical protein